MKHTQSPTTLFCANLDVTKQQQQDVRATRILNEKTNFIISICSVRSTLRVKHRSSNHRQKSGASMATQHNYVRTQQRKSHVQKSHVQVRLTMWIDTIHVIEHLVHFTHSLVITQVYSPQFDPIPYLKNKNLCSKGVFADSMPKTRSNQSSNHQQNSCSQLSCTPLCGQKRFGGEKNKQTNKKRI